jgi:hypothetical protein
MGRLPAANDDRGNANEFRRGRSGHAWPFISRHAVRPARQEAPRPGTAANDHGS